MGFNQYKFRHHLPCPIFHASEASGSEEENFDVFLCISMVQTHNTMGLINIGLRGHHLNKICIKFRP